jgi:hypothetical protein
MRKRRLELLWLAPLRDTEHCAGLPLHYLFAPILLGVNR